MQTICELDAAGVWTGASRAIDDMAGAPPGWVFASRPTVPAGKIARWLGGWSIEDPRAAPPTPPAPVITFKADLWRRATPEEAQVMSADLQDADAQLRELYLAVQYLDHTAPEFGVLRSSLVARFGEKRADELLAPSEA